jgi:hypothetical protein
MPFYDPGLEAGATPIETEADRLFMAGYLAGGDDVTLRLSTLSDAYLDHFRHIPKSEIWHRRVALELARRAARREPKPSFWRRLLRQAR